MNVSKYESFIPQNTAPYGVEKIGVYNKRTNELVGEFRVQNLRLKGVGQKLYSFGALSDIHVQYETAQADFQRALTYFNETEKVAFTCICGDLTDNGEAADFQTYANYVKAYSPNTDVYEATGNHDVQTTRATKDFLKPYTEHDLYYSFTKENDVFIMFGMSGWSSYTGDIFDKDALQWLYDTLEANRDKRCIVFQHCPRFDGSGKPYSPNPTGNLLDSTGGKVFRSLMSHYPNIIWFHGHTHMKFNCQEDCSYANYDKMFGCHSVHIPSLAWPRKYIPESNSYEYEKQGSEGYVVDMYENHMVLRGRDFVNEKFLPIATYCIDTRFTPVAANTFTDSTGTIKTT